MHCIFQTETPPKETSAPQEGEESKLFLSDESLTPLLLENDAPVWKRKLDESESGVAPDNEPKRIKMGDDENEAEEMNINEAMPHEMIFLILQETTHHSVVMWVVCRQVCRLWKDLLLRSVSFKKRASKEWKNVPKFCVEAALRGWFSLLSWGLSKSGRERYLLEKLCWAAAKKERMEILTWIAANYKMDGEVSSFQRRPWQERPNERTSHC